MYHCLDMLPLSPVWIGLYNRIYNICDMGHHRVKTQLFLAYEGNVFSAGCGYTLDNRECYQELNMREMDFLQLPPLKSSAILIGTGDRFTL